MVELTAVGGPGNGPWREIAAARAWLEAHGFRREPRRPEWKWGSAEGARARLRYRVHYGFYWEFLHPKSQQTEIAT